MWGGKRWLSQVNDHEVSAEFEVESGRVVLKLEGAWACRTKKAGLRNAHAMGRKAMGGNHDAVLPLPPQVWPNCVRGISLKLVRSPLDFAPAENADLTTPRSRIELEN